MMAVTIDPAAAEARCERTLRKSGNSTVVTLPPEILQQAGIERGDDVLLVAGLGEGTITLERTADEETETEDTTGDDQ